MDFTAYKHEIFNIQGEQKFNEAALSLFHFQYHNNTIYKAFVDTLGIHASGVYHTNQIPFLPISFFKTHKVVTGEFQETLVFESSGTTGQSNSHHYVADAELYETSFTKCIQEFYGDLSQYALFALLPSYLERGNSSLVYMVDKLMKLTDPEFSGFYLYNLDELRIKLAEAARKGIKIMLIGVTYALLDMAENFPIRIPDAIIIETGGMKGRRKELTRMELHEKLCEAFGVHEIHSEYGMTELLSQAWSAGNGIYQCPPWMKILISDPNDPLTFLDNGRTGGINVIDLANVHSCSFIATQDLGRSNNDGSFEVLGRFDTSDIRGCSLMTV